MCQGDVLSMSGSLLGRVVILAESRAVQVHSVAESSHVRRSTAKSQLAQIESQAKELEARR